MEFARRASSDFTVGCQAYSFNRFDVMTAIEKTAQAGGTIIEFYPGQKVDKALLGAWDENASDATIAAVQAQLAKFNIRAVSFGVVNLGRDEQKVRRVFDFARKMNLSTLSCEPDAMAFDLLDKLVKEYNIRLAIHNHPHNGNPNYRYWDPAYVLSVVKNRDKRIGACADTGHWVRSGIKPLEAIRLLEGRVHELHLKDLNAFGPRAHDVPYGTGSSDIGGILRELRRQKFDGHIAVEYEYNWENSVPDIAQCVGYVRGWEAVAGK